MTDKMLVAGGALLRGVVGFLSLSLYVRWLTPSEYGIFSLFYSFQMLVDSLAFFWLRTVYVRYYHHDENLSDRAIAVLGQVFAVSCLVCLAAGALASIILPVTWRYLAPLVAGVLIGEAICQQLQTANRVRNQPWPFLAVSILRPLCALALGGVLVTYGWGLSGVFWGIIGASVITLIPFFRIEYEGLRLLFAPFDSALLGRLMIFGLPLIALAASEYAARVSERAISADILGLTVFGAYAAASDLVTRIIGLMAMSLHSSFYPDIVKAMEKEGASAARSKLSRSAEAIGAVIVPAAIGISVLSPAVGAIILGPKVGHIAAPLIPFFSLAALMMCTINYYVAQGFHLARRTNEGLLPAFIYWLGGSTMSFLGAYYFGLWGAVAGSLIGASTYLFVCIWRVKGVFDLPFPARAFSRILLASALMGAAVSSCRGLASSTSLAAGVPLGCAVYGILFVSFDILGMRTKVYGKLQKWRYELGS